MSDSSTPSLIKVTEIFLVPSSFLVAALGTADTNPHRAAVSLLGLIISGLWLMCSREALSESNAHWPDGIKKRHPLRTLALSWLAVVFILGWVVSLISHLALWRQPLGT